jgi:hypothetical protein
LQVLPQLRKRWINVERTLPFNARAHSISVVQQSIPEADSGPRAVRVERNCVPVKGNRLTNLALSRKAVRQQYQGCRILGVVSNRLLQPRIRFCSIARLKRELREKFVSGRQRDIAFFGFSPRCK